MNELTEAYLEIYDEFRPLTTEATFHGKMPGRAIQTRATPSGNYTSSRNEPDQRDSAMKSTLGQMRNNWLSSYENDEIRKTEQEAFERRQRAERSQVASRGIGSDEAQLHKSKKGMWRTHQRTPAYIARQKALALRTSTDPNADLRRKRILKAIRNKEKWGQKHEEIEYLLNLLVTEGYADDYDSAVNIIEAMSDEWFYELLDEAAKDQSDKQIDKGVKTTYKAGNVLDNLHQGRSPGVDKIDARERDAKVERMRSRIKTRRDDLFKEKETREDAKIQQIKKLLGL